MKAYLIRRLLLVVPTFLGISVITFTLLQFSPGNPAYMRLQAIQGAMGGEAIPQDIIDATMKLYGMDKPVHVRYGLWLKRMVTFDFGDSYKDNRPVIDRILESLPITLQLNLISLALIYVISIPIGVHSATHQHSRTDHATTFVLFVLYSLPSFWVAMLLIYFLGGGGGSKALHDLTQTGFERIGMADSAAGAWLLEKVFHFRWFPIFGFGTPRSDDWPFGRWLLDRIHHLCLPVFCLSYASFAGLSRYARAGMIDVVRQDYIRTARAYGFRERTVIFRYALRNSLIPILTLLGSLLPAMIGGSVIIESIFSIPGMGRLFYEAILARDYPMVMGVFSFTAVLTLLGLILSDLLYAIVDPRIRFE